jgi:chromosome partitioning protein
MLACYQNDITMQSTKGAKMIILLGGEKGGTGKTTIATNLAGMRNNNLLLIDTDKQSTASYWCSLRDEGGVYPRVASVQKFDKSVRSECQHLKTKYDDIILDAGGRDSSELRNGLLVADKAIFPLQPSCFDLWTLDRLNTLVETAQQFKGICAD